MRILYLTQYFPPEIGATQNRAYEMASNFVKLGHQVDLITEIPNHPSGIIPKEYHRKIYERSKLNGINVIRVWVKASPVKNLINRLLFYVSYLVNAIIAGLFLLRNKYDLIYATSPPLSVGLAGLILSKLHRTKFIFEVRDMWPASAVALNEISNKSIISFANKLESICYKQARLMVSVTNGIYNQIINLGISQEKLLLIPNGSNTDIFTFKPERRKELRTELGLDNRFIIIYAGIHGIAQCLDTVVETANLFRNQPEIHFLLIGEGPRKESILQQIGNLNLDNITMLPEIPPDQISDYLSAADAALVPLRNLSIFKGALPSKIFDAWACERPILLGVDGEARKVMEEAKGGIFVKPEDPMELSKAIVTLKSMPEKRKQMGINGRKFTVKNYSRKVQAEKLLNHLSKIVND